MIAKQHTPHRPRLGDGRAVAQGRCIEAPRSSGTASRTRRARRPRTKHVHTRAWFTAIVRRNDAETWLDVVPGSRRCVLRRDGGARVLDYCAPKDRLVVAAGEALLVCGPSIEETIGARVVAIHGARVQVQLHGELAMTTRDVQLLKLEMHP